MVWIVTFLDNWGWWLLDGKVFLMSIGSEYYTGLLYEELASGRLDDCL